MVHHGAIAGGNCVPVRLTIRCGNPQRNRRRVHEHLDHVMTWREAQLLKRQFGRQRSGAPQARADDFQSHVTVPLFFETYPEHRDMYDKPIGRSLARAFRSLLTQNWQWSSAGLTLRHFRARANRKCADATAAAR